MAFKRSAVRSRLSPPQGYEKRLVFVRKQAFSLVKVISYFLGSIKNDVRPPIMRAHQLYPHSTNKQTGTMLTLPAPAIQASTHKFSALQITNNQVLH